MLAMMRMLHLSNVAALASNGLTTLPALDFVAATDHANIFRLFNTALSNLERNLGISFIATPTHRL
jgi:hypothetical protein